jgi:hypothetical protein
VRYTIYEVCCLFDGMLYGFKGKIFRLISVKTIYLFIIFVVITIKTIE